MLSGLVYAGYNTTMTRKLKKEIWPYSCFFKTDTDEHGFEIDNDDETMRENWLWENLNEDIRNRVYIIHAGAGTTYYFKQEKDYQWFLWRWI